MADRPTQLARPLSDRLREIPDHRAGSGTVALLLHTLAIGLIVILSRVAPATGTGPLGPPGTGGGGGGGEVYHYVELPGDPAPPPPPEVTPPVIPEVEPELVIPEPVLSEPEVVVMVDSVPLSAILPPTLETGTGTGGGAPEPGAGGGAGSGGGTGGGDGLGDGPGTGGGSGPGQGGGDGTLGRPPMPQMLLFPPSAPRDMRGKSITVHLVVDAQGVVRQVALQPETGNGRLDDDIRRTALSWRFRPGTDAAGTPVTKPYEVVLTF